MVNKMEDNIMIQTIKISRKEMDLIFLEMKSIRNMDISEMKQLFILSNFQVESKQMLN